MLKRQFWIAVALLLLSVLLRIPAYLQLIVDVDESQFALYAHTLLDGGTPYLASVDTKPLGIYWFFAAIFALFGKYNMLAVHVATAVWMWLTALVVAAIAQALASEKRNDPDAESRAPVLAALFLILFSTTYTLKFISTSIVAVMLLPLALSMFFVLRTMRTLHIRDALFAGVFCGGSMLFKYQAGIQLPVALTALFLLWFSRRTTQHKTLQLMLAFIFGVALVGTAFSTYLHSIGAWDAFVQFSLKGSGAYVAAGNQAMDIIRRAFIRGGGFMLCTFLLWWFAAKEIEKTWRQCRRTARECWPIEALSVALWLILSIIPVCTGGRFYGHYFLQLLPSLCVLAALGAHRFIADVEATQWERPRKAALSFFFAGLFLPVVIPFGLRMAAPLMYQWMNEDHAELYEPIGRYLRERSTPEDTVFVWGFATPIYFFAERTAASRFLWTDWQSGRISGTPNRVRTSDEPPPPAAPFPGSWELLFADLEQHKPLYIVDTAPGNYHGYGNFPISDFPALQMYLLQHYTLESNDFGVNFWRRNP